MRKQSMMRSILESVEQKEQARQLRESGRCEKCGGAMKEGRCVECGYMAEDSGLQIYATEPSGSMREALTVDEMRRVCPECAENMVEHGITAAKLSFLVESGVVEEVNIEEDVAGAVLIEKEGEDGWPKKLRKGRF